MGKPKEFFTVKLSTLTKYLGADANIPTSKAMLNLLSTLGGEVTRIEEDQKLIKLSQETPIAANLQTLE